MLKGFKNALFGIVLVSLFTFASADSGDPRRGNHQSPPVVTIPVVQSRD